jgi:hypothetical protein
VNAGVVGSFPRVDVLALRTTVREETSRQDCLISRRAMTSVRLGSCTIAASASVGCDLLAVAANFHVAPAAMVGFVVVGEPEHAGVICAALHEVEVCCRQHLTAGGALSFRPVCVRVRRVGRPRKLRSGRIGNPPQPVHERSARAASYCLPRISSIA